jgi:hypothetical protein
MRDALEKCARFPRSEGVTRSVTKPQKGCDQAWDFLDGRGEKARKINGRGDRIRTCDIYVPKVPIQKCASIAVQIAR